MASIDPDKIDLTTVDIKPTSNNVLLKLDPFKEISDGGIYLPPESRIHEGYTATVIAVGPGKRNKKGVRIPCELKPGDRVFIWRYMSYDYQFEGDTYRVMPEDKIDVVIEE